MFVKSKIKRFYLVSIHHEFAKGIQVCSAITATNNVLCFCRSNWKCLILLYISHKIKY